MEERWHTRIRYWYHIFNSDAAREKGAASVGRERTPNSLHLFSPKTGCTASWWIAFASLVWTSEWLERAPNMSDSPERCLSFCFYFYFFPPAVRILLLYTSLQNTRSICILKIHKTYQLFFVRQFPKSRPGVRLFLSPVWGTESPLFVDISISLLLTESKITAAKLCLFEIRLPGLRLALFGVQSPSFVTTPLAYHHHGSSLERSFHVHQFGPGGKRTRYHHLDTSIKCWLTLDYLLVRDKCDPCDTALCRAI